MPPKKISIVKAGATQKRSAASDKWLEPGDLDVAKLELQDAKETVSGLWIPIKYDGRNLRMMTGTVRTPTGAGPSEKTAKWGIAIAIDPENDQACALSEAVYAIAKAVKEAVLANAEDLKIDPGTTFRDAVYNNPDESKDFAPLFRAALPLFSKEFSTLFVRTGSPDFRLAPNKLQELMPKDTFFMAVVELGGCYYIKATATDEAALGLWFKYHTIRLLNKDELLKVRKPSTQARAVASAMLAVPINSSPETEQPTPEPRGPPPKKRPAAATNGGDAKRQRASEEEIDEADLVAVSIS